MPRRGMLICFIGIDGSGKTTLAKEITNVIRLKKGANCQYVYGRVVPIVSRVFMWIGRKILLKERKDAIFHNYNHYISKKRRMLKSSIWSRIYEFLILFDQIVQVNLKIRPRLWAGKTIVCDRYIHDTVVTDLAPDLGYSNEKVVRLINKLLKLVPKPDIVFIVDVPEEVAYARKNDIPHLDYLRERRRIYLEIGKIFEIPIIDGTFEIADLTYKVYRVLDSLPLDAGGKKI